MDTIHVQMYPFTSILLYIHIWYVQQPNASIYTLTCTLTLFYYIFFLFHSIHRESTSAPPSVVKLPVRYADLLLMSAVFLIWSKPEDLLLISVFTNSPRGDLEATRELSSRERISRLSMLHREQRLLEHKIEIWYAGVLIKEINELGNCDSIIVSSYVLVVTWLSI